MKIKTLTNLMRVYEVIKTEHYIRVENISQLCNIKRSILNNYLITLLNLGLITYDIRAGSKVYHPIVITKGYI